MVAPIDRFHRYGIMSAARGPLKQKITLRAGSKMHTLFEATSFALDDGILETKRKFSDLCEEFVLDLGRAEVLTMLEQKAPD